MFFRVRIAMGLALVAILVTSVVAFAKGGFDFISITGPGLKQEVQIDDTSLTEDFFAFANFYEDEAKAPDDPRQGYEITRHYVQGASDVIFDRLHYYPETGFVFYDGIENGESEYDGGWYLANPDIKSVFESALGVQVGSAAPVAKEQPSSAVTESRPAAAVNEAKPVDTGIPSPLIPVIVLTAGLAALFAVALWRRRASAQ